MSWLLAAYGAVAIAIVLYCVRIARLKKALCAEIDARKR